MGYADDVRATRRNLRGTWIEVLAIAALAVGAGTLANHYAAPKNKLTWIGNISGISDPSAVPSPAPGATPAAPAAGAGEIDTAQAFDEWNKGALFLDARPAHSFEEGHIPKARSFGVWEGDVDTKVIGLFAEGMRPDTRMICYCTGGSCEDSHHLKDKLASAGFTNVAVYKDGFPGWTGAGHPVEK